MEDVEEWSLAGGSAVVHSAPAPGRPGPNQDAAAVVPVGARSAVLAVADGVGGERSGAQASSLAVHALADAVIARPEGGTLRSAILDGFEAANGAVRALGGGAATTLAVLEVEEGVVRPYHVGDSVVLVFGQRAKVKLHTTSHSPVGFALAAGVLDADEAMHHEDRHVVSNVLGTEDMRIEIGSTRRLAARDTVLLASDGLTDNLHLEETLDFARRGALAAAARKLRDAAVRRMLEPAEGEPSKPDDLTFVLFRPGPP